VQAISPYRVVREIETLLGEFPDGVIAFDGDGTLWSGDVGEDFFFAFSDRGEYREAATERLAAEAARIGLPSEMDGAAYARALFRAYEKGLYPEDLTCEMIAWSPAGWAPSLLHEFVEKILDEGKIAERAHSETRKVIDWAAKRNVPVYVVSASPRAVVEVAAARVGIDSSRVIAVTQRLEKGVLLAEVERPIPYAEGKVKQLRRRIGERPLLAAFGDNVFDVEMLGASKIPLAVRPKPRLLEVAEAVPGLRTLEV